MLNHSLVIKLESPDVKNFDPQQSIMHWNTSGVRARRPMSKPLGFRINSGNAEEVETSNPIEIEAQAEMEHSDSVSDVDDPADYESDESDNELLIFNDLLELELEYEF